MVFIPLMLLSLTGGIFLLIQVESKGLSRLYRLLSWLVIFLSLLFLSAGVVRGVIHHRHMRHEHRQFFMERGRGFGQHHFGGPPMHFWKYNQDAAPDSTGK